MTPEKLEEIAAQGGWNPYYLAYALATGATDPDEAFKRDGNNVGFILWNEERWVETKKRHGIPLHSPASYMRAEHIQTLCDHLNKASDGVKE